MRKMLALLQVELLTIASAVMLAVAGPASAGKLEVIFLPPDIKLPPNVCALRARDDQMIANWTAWNGVKLPVNDNYAVQRDMGKLRDLDAVKYEKIIKRIITLMPTIKPGYSETDAKFDMVRTMLAMGEGEKVKSQHLVDDLLDKPGNSMGALNSLADLLLEGKGIDIDRAKGLKLKVEAAYGGSADAMLDLVAMTEGGRKVDNWDINPDIAINMAFGSLVGALDSGICDRVGRIAREFLSGDLIKADPGASEAWYRFAADLGDTYSAWRVAEFHLQSELIEKNNDILVKYLTLAADGGNMSALLELGKLYDDGTLVEANKVKAQHYFSVAAGAGNQAGLIRMAQLFEETKDRSPQDAGRYEQALRTLVSSEHSPAWAASRLARILMAKTGSWAVTDEARALYEQAALHGDADGKMVLADLILRQGVDKSSVNKATNLLIDAAQSDGKTDAIADLHRLYLCVDPAGPNFKSAEYWSNLEDGAGNKSLQMEPEQVVALVHEKDPLFVASMQTQALYKRPTALALYRRFITDTRQDPQIQSFWAAYGDSEGGTEVAKDFIDFKVDLLEHKYDAARKRAFEKNVEESTDAAVGFSRFLLETYPQDPESITRAVKILQPVAERGVGAAVVLLKDIEAKFPALVPDGTEKYEQPMKDRGDMQAQLMLADRATDPEMQKFYYARAKVSQGCDYDDTMLLADYAMRHRISDDAQRWLTVAQYVSGVDTWRMVKIGDIYMGLNDAPNIQTALKLYETAQYRGEPAAFFRLVRFYGNYSSPNYDPVRAGTLFTQLLTRAKLDDVPADLAQLSRMKPEIQRVVKAKIDIMDLYQRSADEGHPVAMRELAKLLQQHPGSAADAAAWLTKASNAGDPEAMFLLARAYAFGTGLQPSLDETRHWLTKAAGGGNADASQMLALMAGVSKD